MVTPAGTVNDPAVLNMRGQVFAALHGGAVGEGVGPGVGVGVGAGVGDTVQSTRTPALVTQTCDMPDDASAPTVTPPETKRLLVGEEGDGLGGGVKFGGGNGLGLVGDGVGFGGQSGSAPSTRPSKSSSIPFVQISGKLGPDEGGRISANAVGPRANFSESRNPV